MNENRCTFISLPQSQSAIAAGETRTFTAGETICIRGLLTDAFNIKKGKYVKAYSYPPTPVSMHSVNVRMPGGSYKDMPVLYTDLGKWNSVVPEIAVSAFAREQNMPENIEREIKKYLGGKRKSNGTRKRSGRSKKSKKTRKH